jgi:hypothetical protein
MSQMNPDQKSQLLASGNTTLVRSTNELPPASDPGREAFRAQVAEMKAQGTEPSLKDTGKEALGKLITDLRGKWEGICNFAKPHIDNAIQIGKDTVYTAVGAALDPKAACKQSSEAAAAAWKENSEKTLTGAKNLGAAGLNILVVGGATAGALTALGYKKCSEKAGEFFENTKDASLKKGAEVLSYLGSQKENIGKAWSEFGKATQDQFQIMRNQMINARYEAVLKTPLGRVSEFQNSRLAHELDPDQSDIFNRGKGFNTIRENFRNNLYQIRVDTANSIYHNKSLSGEDQRTHRLDTAKRFHEDVEAVFKEHRHTVTAYKAIDAALKNGKPRVAAGHLEDFIESKIGEVAAEPILAEIRKLGGIQTLQSSQVVQYMNMASNSGRSASSSAVAATAIEITAERA